VSQNGVLQAQTFRDDQNGDRVPVSKQIKRDRIVRGWEFEMFGQPADKLTFMVTANVSSGEVPATLYPHDIIEPTSLIDTVSGLIRYDFSVNSGKGFSVRAGGKFWDDGWNTRARKAYPYTRKQFVLDVGASYKWDEGKNEIDFKINNANDEFVIVAGNANYDLPF
jgi:outer membrane receptor protein involved in Fe transport